VTPNVVAMIEGELPAEAQLPIPEARWRLRRVVTALRLWRAGSVSLPSSGWARADDGPWRQVALQPAPPARGGAWALSAQEEDGFRQFAALVAAWEPTGPLAWALARFDMGCERSSDGEALSDYLLALRGLLDAVDEAGQPTLARRLAALCAEEPNRRLLMSHVEAALNLELALINGVPIDAWVAPRGIHSGRELVHEMEEHLRALLRDVVCGYLKPELASMADEILIQSEPVEIHARDLRVDADPVTTAAAPLDPPTEQSLPPEYRSPADHPAAPDPPAAPHHERHPVREFVRPVALVPPEAEPSVTRLVDVINEPPSQLPTHEQPALVVDDFAWDLDDPGDYSAPA
jgi:hypothetical protein